MNNEDIKITEFDRLSFNGSTQMMKAMLPYIPVNLQHSFAYAIMFREFSNLRHNISKASSSELGICSVNHQSASVSDILKDLRQYGSEKQQKFIDMMINMLQTVSVYQQYMQLLSGSSAGFSDSFDFNIDDIMKQFSMSGSNP